jgi:hypothetical protein
MLRDASVDLQGMRVSTRGDHEDHIVVAVWQSDRVLYCNAVQTRERRVIVLRQPFMAYPHTAFSLGLLAWAVSWSCGWEVV